MLPSETASSAQVDRNRAAAGIRRYRSKAQRPCDLCRARKALCNIPDPSKPCQLCDRTGRPCTFLVGTRRRPSRLSPNMQSPGPSDFMGQTSQCPTTFTENELLPAPAELTSSYDPVLDGTISSAGIPTPWPLSMEQDVIEPPAFDIQNSEMPDFWSPQFRDTALGMTVGNSPNLEPAQISTGHHTTLNWQGRSSTFIGYSNESDPFLLEHYPYNADDELDFFMVTYRRPSPQDVTIGFPPVHFLQSKAQAASEGQEAMSNCFAVKNEKELLHGLVGPDMSLALLRL